MGSLRISAAIAAGLAGAALFAVPASASAALSPAGDYAVSSLPGARPSSVVISITNFDVTGILSFDPIGDPLNQVFSISLAPGASVIGLGWDVTLFADPPSWLSESVVSFGSTSSPYILDLTVGIGDDFPGTESYTSGGILNLVDLGLSFSVDADGLLRLEFWESFDDFPDDWDNRWESGVLSIQWSTGVIPEPATWAMMIAGFGLVGVAARRRRATGTA
jgi:hypothetical protein